MDRNTNGDNISSEDEDMDRNADGGFSSSDNDIIAEAHEHRPKTNFSKLLKLPHIQVPYKSRRHMEPLIDYQKSILFMQEEYLRH